LFQIFVYRSAAIATFSLCLFLRCTVRSAVQPEASPTTSHGGSSSSSPLSARGKLVNMVRVFKEDIQKRKDESDRKSGKGGSGTIFFAFAFSSSHPFVLFCLSFLKRVLGFVLLFCHQDLELLFCILNLFKKSSP
jgi:hypothetical protein